MGFLPPFDLRGHLVEDLFNIGIAVTVVITAWIGRSSECTVIRLQDRPTADLTWAIDNAARPIFNVVDQPAVHGVTIGRPCSRIAQHISLN